VDPQPVRTRTRKRKIVAVAAVVLVLGAGAAVAEGVSAASGDSANFYQLDGACRIVDTRTGLGGHFGKVNHGEQVMFTTSSSPCWTEGGVSAHSAYATVTAVEATANGYMKMRETAALPLPNGTWMNFSNQYNTSQQGILNSLWATKSFVINNFGGSTHYVVDVVGYFYGDP